MEDKFILPLTLTWRQLEMVLALVNDKTRPDVAGLRYQYAAFVQPKPRLAENLSLQVAVEVNATLVEYCFGGQAAQKQSLTAEINPELEALIMNQLVYDPSIIDRLMALNGQPSEVVVPKLNALITSLFNMNVSFRKEREDRALSVYMDAMEMHLPGVVPYVPPAEAPVEEPINP